MSREKIIYILFLVFISYFLVLAIYFALLAVIAFFQGRKRDFESKEEDYGLLSRSHFTVPVSVILPAHNEERWIADSLRALLNLNYPEFEIIVVNDASVDKTQGILDTILELQSLDVSYSSQFSRAKIHEVYKSRRYSNVTVIKSSGFRKAGALNAGLNFARYKYICIIDADTILEPEALLNVMGVVEKDPERIIGIGSYFGMVNGFKIEGGRILNRSFSYNPLIAYQHLEYIRSFIGNRLSWGLFNAMPNVSGGFGVWRRDILAELGGFDPNFSSEDIELTFRAHDYIVKNRKDYRIVSLPYCVGWTEGPETIRSLIIQRKRWQRVTDETVWRYKYMMLNPRFKWFAFLTYPYFVFYEALGIFFEIISMGLVIWASFVGLLSWNIFFAYLVFMMLSQAVISLFALATFIRGQKLFPVKYTCYMLVLSFFELLFYRWIIFIAKLLGTLGFLRGVKTYEQYKRP